MARAPVSKFYRDRPGRSLRITERPDLSALLECPGVPRPFPSRLVPWRSVANSVATGRQLFSAEVAAAFTKEHCRTDGASTALLRSFAFMPSRSTRKCGRAAARRCGDAAAHWTLYNPGAFFS